MRPSRPPRLIRITLLLLLSLLFHLTSGSRPRPHVLSKRNPTFSPISLTSPTFQQLSQLSNLDENFDWKDENSVLSKVLIPRTVGSKNLKKIQEMFVDKFKKLGWHVEKDEFTTSTPRGLKTFTNLIFIHDPLAIRRFTLSAHLDSKISPQGFVGATDSAVPCVLLYDLASSLNDWLNERKKRVVEEEGGEEGRDGVQGETLQIVLFDGEEAFEEWSSIDSIYGARHLVEKWESTTTDSKVPGITPSATRLEPRNELEKISHFVLLDLLGSKNPVIRNFYQNTGWLFDEFLHSEEKLGRSGLLWPNSPNLKGNEYVKVSKDFRRKEKSFFVDRKSPQSWIGTIEDDHLPFLKKGVPIVHLISVPFPKVWHTLEDDSSTLDLDTIKAWALIIRLTVAEYLGLDPEIQRRPTENKRQELISRSFDKEEEEEMCSTTKDMR
ncbi:hypothetical protein JCM5350_003741 [Sporobolomyces pararoseus]